MTSEEWLDQWGRMVQNPQLQVSLHSEQEIYMRCTKEEKHPLPVRGKKHEKKNKYCGSIEMKQDKTNIF